MHPSPRFGFLLYLGSYKQCGPAVCLRCGRCCLWAGGGGSCHTGTEGGHQWLLKNMLITRVCVTNTSTVLVLNLLRGHLKSEKGGVVAPYGATPQGVGRSVRLCRRTHQLQPPPPAHTHTHTHKRNSPRFRAGIFLSISLAAPPGTPAAAGASQLAYSCGSKFLFVLMAGWLRWHGTTGVL